MSRCGAVAMAFGRGLHNSMTPNRSFLWLAQRYVELRVTRACLLVMLQLTLLLLVIAPCLSDWLRLHLNRHDLLLWARANGSAEFDWLASINIDRRFYSRIRGLFYECITPDMCRQHTVPEWLNFDNVSDDLVNLQQHLQSNVSRLTFWQCWSIRQGDQCAASPFSNKTQSEELRRAAILEDVATVACCLAPILVALHICVFLMTSSIDAVHLPMATKLFSAGFVLQTLSAVSQALGLAAMTTAEKIMTEGAPDSAFNSFTWPSELASRSFHEMGAAQRMAWVAMVVVFLSLVANVYFLMQFKKRWAKAMNGAEDCRLTPVDT